MWILTFEIHASESDASNVIQATLNQDLGRGDQKNTVLASQILWKPLADQKEQTETTVTDFKEWIENDPWV